MITIAGHIAIRTIGNLLRVIVNQVVPDGFALAVFIPCSLNLVCRSSYAELEIIREFPLGVCKTRRGNQSV